MNYVFKWVWCILITILLCSNIVYAGGGKPIGDILPVGKALEIAFEKNRDLKALEAKIKAAEASSFEYFPLSSPSISIMEEGIEAGNFTEKQIRLSQSIASPLTWIYGNISVSEKVEAENLAYENLKIAIKSKVKEAYAGLSFNLKLIDLRTRQTALADSLRQVVNYRSEAGVATELEVLKSEIFYQEALNELNDVKKEYHISRYALFTIIGLNPDEQTYQISFPDTLQFVDFDIKQAEALAALDNHPAVMSQHHLYRSDIEKTNAIRGKLFPEFNLSWYKQDFGTGYNQYGYEIGISIPLWYPFTEARENEVYEMNAEQTKNSMEQTVLEFKRNIEFAWHGYHESKQKIERYDKLIREKSGLLLSLTLEAYKEGQISLLELLDSEKMYLSNEIKYYNELRDYYLHIIELEKYLGKDLVFTSK
jgi:cobalt-zinc-cadmium efflux system outer membrane protein